MLEGGTGEDVSVIKGLKGQLAAKTEMAKTLTAKAKLHQEMGENAKEAQQKAELALKKAENAQAAAVKDCVNRHNEENKVLMKRHDAEIDELRSSCGDRVKRHIKKHADEAKEIKALYKKQLSAEETRGKKNLDECEEKRKADSKEVKDKHAVDLREKGDEIVSLKKKLGRLNQEHAKEIEKERSIHRNREYNETRAKLSVEVHAQKQAINEAVHRERQESVRQKRDYLMASASQSNGFCGMMNRANNHNFNNSLAGQPQMMPTQPGMMMQMPVMMNGQSMMVSLPIGSHGMGSGNSMAWDGASEMSMSNMQQYQRQGAMQGGGFHNDNYGENGGGMAFYGDNNNDLEKENRSVHSRHSVPGSVDVSRRGHDWVRSSRGDTRNLSAGSGLDLRRTSGNQDLQSSAASRFSAPHRSRGLGLPADNGNIPFEDGNISSPSSAASKGDCRL